MSTSTGGATLLVLKSNVSFVLGESEGLRKKWHLHLRLEMKTLTLCISSRRYSWFEGIGISFNEWLNWTCSMFLTQIVLNSKSNMSNFTRALGLDDDMCLSL